MPERSLLPSRPALFTDQYELTMARAYLAEGMRGEAVFELFFRTLPENRSFIVAAGLADVLVALESLHFSEEDLEFLARQRDFDAKFIDELRDFRFTGDVYAVPEGTIVFPHEPIVQVHAPIAEAQLVETIILNQVHLQSILATKAARVVFAARGRTLVEFGARRAHGYDAALKAARASYIVGFAATSNVLAGATYGIPIAGTMAHSYVQAHADEGRAFESFNELFPGTTLLIDTYDTIHGAQEVIALARRLGDRFQAAAVRLDSGDVDALSRRVRRLFDEADLTRLRIFVSGGLDEYQVDELVEGGAPIDAFGVGTSLAVSEDAPSLDMVYKLVSYENQPRLKLSTGKGFLPGPKQIFREICDGFMVRDLLAVRGEECRGETLLRPVMKRGVRLTESRMNLEEVRSYARSQLELLPEHLRALYSPTDAYEVHVSDSLHSLRSHFGRG